MTDVATAPLDLVGPGGRMTTLARSLAVVRSADGRTGVAWRERNQPHPRPPRAR